MNEILINRMYAGDYLSDENNIGHEIINLFKSDNGNHYIYLTSKGDFGVKHSNNIKTVLLVRAINNSKAEILAKADDLEQVLELPSNYVVAGGIKALKKEHKEKNQKWQMRHEIYQKQIDYIKNNSVTYGGKLLHDLYKDNVTSYMEVMIMITFKSKRFRKPLKPLYITNLEPQNKNEYKINVERVCGQSLSMFFSKDDELNNYSILESIINDDSLWEDSDTCEKVDLNDIKENKTSFMQIIKKEYDELAYSNMIGYYLSDKNMFSAFCKEVLNITPKGEHTIIRESVDNIDLLIYDDKNVLVLENKIKSSINGIKHDIYGNEIQNQLKKYYDAINKKEEFKNKNKAFFILAPDYNNFDIKHFISKEAQQYKIIRYSKLLEFFINYRNINNEKTEYYNEFLTALEKHSKPIDNNHYEDMLRRMKRMIEKA